MVKTIEFTDSDGEKLVGEIHSDSHLILYTENENPRIRGVVQFDPRVAEHRAKALELAHMLLAVATRTEEGGGDLK